jgi:hypothetical protein
MRPISAIKSFFSNKWVHRAYYLFLLVAWIWFFSDRFGCLTCGSSLWGAPYIAIIAPVALVLLVQVFWDTKFGWAAFFVLSLLLYSIFLVGEVSFFKEYQSKMMISDADVLKNQIYSAAFLTAIYGVFLLITWLIRPQEQKQFTVK